MRSPGSSILRAGIASPLRALSHALPIDIRNTVSPCTDGGSPYTVQSSYIGTYTPQDTMAWRIFPPGEYPSGFYYQGSPLQPWEGPKSWIVHGRADRSDTMTVWFKADTFDPIVKTITIPFKNWGTLYADVGSGPFELSMTGDAYLSPAHWAATVPGTGLQLSIAGPGTTGYIAIGAYPVVGAITGLGYQTVTYTKDSSCDNPTGTYTAVDTLGQPLPESFVVTAS